LNISHTQIEVFWVMTPWKVVMMSVSEDLSTSIFRVNIFICMRICRLLSYSAVWERRSAGPRKTRCCFTGLWTRKG